MRDILGKMHESGNRSKYGICRTIVGRLTPMQIERTNPEARNPDHPTLYHSIPPVKTCVIKSIDIFLLMLEFPCPIIFLWRSVYGCMRHKSLRNLFTVAYRWYWGEANVPHLLWHGRSSEFIQRKDALRNNATHMTRLDVKVPAI